MCAGSSCWWSALLCAGPGDYRGQLAVDHATFDLEPGSITGLLGRNGAGKTPLMRILAGHELAGGYGTVRRLTV